MWALIFLLDNELNGNVIIGSHMVEDKTFVSTSDNKKALGTIFDY